MQLNSFFSFAFTTNGCTIIIRLSTTLDEVSVYPIPALLYLVKNLLQVSYTYFFWGRNNILISLMFAL